MDAIQLLKQEHETAKKMFAQIREARGEHRGQLWTKLKPELKVHETMEETALYRPIAQEASADEQLKDWQEHHHEEVAELESLIQEISESDPTDEEWMEKIEELEETLEHHIEEEEGDIWPRIQEVWDRSKLEQAGQQMEGIKRQHTGRAA
jgi:hemerythrin-like domain-containing protein